MNDFESKPESFPLFYYSDDTKSNEEKEESHLVKDFDSKSGSFLFYHGDDAKSKEEPLVKDFEAKSESFLFYQAKSKDEKPADE